MNNESFDWYVLHVQPKHERTVKSALKNKGIASYLPVTKVLKRWSDQEKQVLMPLFPGLIFCHLQESEKELVLRMNQVQGFVSEKYKNAPLNISEENLARVRQIEKSQPEILNGPIKNGREIEVKKGPLAGLRGALGTFNETKRLLLNLPFLNYRVAVEITLFEIDSVKESQILAS